MEFDPAIIASIIGSSKTFISVGPSGLSNEYLKSLVSNESFIDLLKVVFEKLIAEPQEISNIPELY